MYQITNIFYLNYNIIISYFFQKIKKNVLQAASWLPSKLQPKFLHAIWQCVRLLDFVERGLPVRLTLLSFDVLLNSLHSHFMMVYIQHLSATQLLPRGGVLFKSFRVIGFEPMTSPFQAEPSTKLSLHPDNWRHQRELNPYCKDENLVSLPLDDSVISCL